MPAYTASALVRVASDTAGCFAIDWSLSQPSRFVGRWASVQPDQPVCQECVDPPQTFMTPRVAARVLRPGPRRASATSAGADSFNVRSGLRLDAQVKTQYAEMIIGSSPNASIGE